MYEWILIFTLRVDHELCDLNLEQRNLQTVITQWITQPNHHAVVRWYGSTYLAEQLTCLLWIYDKHKLLFLLPCYGRISYIRYTKGYRCHKFLHYSMLSLGKKKATCQRISSTQFVTTPKKAVPPGRKVLNWGIVSSYRPKNCWTTDEAYSGCPASCSKNNSFFFAHLLFTSFFKKNHFRYSLKERFICSKSSSFS